MNIFFGLEYHLVDSCNLKCAGCSHYSSLIDEKICIPFETIINDLSKLKDKVGDNLKWLRLLGGEPLVHPKISDCIEEIRNPFPNTKIFIVTNGILLGKMDDAFYNSCVNCIIEIGITDYGIIGLQAAINKLKDFGINAICCKSSRIWNYQYIRLTEERIDCLRNCMYKRICNNYRDGKIYLCPHIAYIEYFNKRFDKNIHLDETDYIDLNDVNSFEELIEKLRNVTPNFCYQYCNYYDRNHPKIGKWDRTKKDINEFCLL
jgi:wyosine [tRNA(Phe)-imidazoG37] synthetase (radical SAM superfamily)